MKQPRGGRVSRVTLCLLDKCNLNCKYCFSEKYSIATQLNLETVSKFIEKLDQKDKIEEITITGGEPFLYSEFVNLVKVLAKVSCEMIVLSNGTIVNSEQLGKR